MGRRYDFFANYIIIFLLCKIKGRPEFGRPWFVGAVETFQETSLQRGYAIHPCHKVYAIGAYAIRPCGITS